MIKLLTLLWLICLFITILIFGLEEVDDNHQRKHPMKFIDTERTQHLKELNVTI